MAGIVVLTDPQDERLKLTDDQEIDLEKLDKGDLPVQVNFFLINPVTGKGFYQHYYRSTSMRTFLAIQRGLYRAWLKFQKEEHVASRPDADDAELRAIRKQYRGSLDFRVMLRPGDFIGMVEALHSIKSVQVDLATDAQPGFAQALRAEAKQERRTYSFGADASLAGIVAGIQAVFDDGPEGLKVSGEDADGLGEVVRLDFNEAKFAEYQYTPQKFRLDEFVNATPMQKLIELASTPEDWLS